MPYKSKERRWDLDDGGNMNNAGDLAYVISQVIRAYLVGKTKRWELYADVIKAIDSVIDAYKEEVLLPYERQKRKENGSVYE